MIIVIMMVDDAVGGDDYYDRWRRSAMTVVSAVMVATRWCWLWWMVDGGWWMVDDG